MATIVQQINDAVETRLDSLLGSEYSPLDYYIDIESNHFKGARKRYSVRPVSGVSTDSITKVYTMNHDWEITVTHDYINKRSDADQREKTFILYDKMDDIVRDLHTSKAGLPSVVMNIEAVTYDEPEFLDEHNVAILRGFFTIKYRNALT